MSTYNVAQLNEESVFYLFPKIVTECLLWAGVNGRVVIYSFIQQIFIEPLPKARGDKHLPFIYLSNIHLLSIYYLLAGDEIGHLFFCTTNLLSIYYVPGTVLGPGGTAEKIDLALVKFVFSCSNISIFSNCNPQ